MTKREQILNDAMSAASEKTFTPEITLRRIGVREETLMEMAGSPFLKPEVLAKFRDGEVPEGVTLLQTQELLFICSTPPETVRDLLKAGRELFEDAVFAFLEKIPSREVQTEMIIYVLGDLIGIRAALFKSAEESAGTSKNAHSPAE